MEVLREGSNEEEYENTCSETEQKAEDKLHDPLNTGQSSLDYSSLNITRNV